MNKLTETIKKINKRRKIKKDIKKIKKARELLINEYNKKIGLSNLDEITKMLDAIYMPIDKNK